MRPFSEFVTEGGSFWAFVKFITEKLGYTDRRSGLIKSYTYQEIVNLCNSLDIPATESLIERAKRYCEARANVINNTVQYNLMNAEQAENLFYQIYNDGQYQSKIIMNKQSGDKKRVSYFTGIITMIAESVLGSANEFDPDPRGLMYLIDNGKILGNSSRRFDGAYPSIYSPKLVWEIKEYYYTTTFGSRIADGVYETQLDGYELNEIYDRTGHKIYHVLFVDSYPVWWEQGKSYLIRLIDTLNMGLVDEVIFGKEVLTEWEAILSEIRR